MQSLLHSCSLQLNELFSKSLEIYKEFVVVLINHSFSSNCRRYTRALFAVRYAKWNGFIGKCSVYPTFQPKFSSVHAFTPPSKRRRRNSSSYASLYNFPIIFGGDKSFLSRREMPSGVFTLRVSEINIKSIRYACVRVISPFRYSS